MCYTLSQRPVIDIASIDFSASWAIIPGHFLEEVYLGMFKAAQRQRERSHIPTTHPSMQSGRQSALLPTPTSRPAPADRQAQFEYDTRFGHSLKRISILPPALQHQPVVQRMVPGTGTSGTTAPSTTLRAVETKNDNGAAGSFEYRKRWEVDHPVAGIIVQHVTREFHVHEVGSIHEMTGAEIDSYIGGGSSNAYGTVLEYWELWTVDASGKVGPVDEDTFGLCAIKPKKTRGYRDTTTGTFTITGVANFYPNTTAPDLLGFTLNGVETAGGLYSTATDPTSSLGPTMGSTIRHEVKVVWDTETINPVSRATPYPPRPKWKAGTADSQVTSTYS